MKNSLLICVMTIIISACGTKNDAVTPLKLWAEIDLSAAPNSLTAKERKNGWQLLFDGETFGGWHGYNMTAIPDVWSIYGDCIVVDGAGGGEEEQDIVSDKLYGRFAFTLEYKLSKGSNSGVVFQVKEDPKYKFSYETGPEFQLIDHDNWYDPLEDWQIHGANYAMYPPETKPYRPVGEWNRLLLVVDGNHVTQIINGTQVVSYEKYSDDWTRKRNSGKWTDFPDWGKFDEGQIAIQNHGTKLWFRNIMIKQL
jgi:hypothetical protein